jgi:hypothetical protein
MRDCALTQVGAIQRCEVSIGKLVSVAFVAVAIVGSMWVLVRSPSREQRVTTGVGLVDHAVRRGGYGNWIEFDYPAGWFVRDGSYTLIQSGDPELQGAQYGDKVEIHDEADWSLDRGPEPYPDGTVTDTVVIDGITATRTEFPPFEEGVRTGLVALEVPSDESADVGVPLEADKSSRRLDNLMPSRGRVRGQRRRCGYLGGSGTRTRK